MNKDNINISKIETYINSIIDNVVSRNTFFGSLPEKEIIDDSWEDMVFVDIPNGIMDMEAYGQGMVLILLYARPLSSGRKNVAKMSQLEQKLNEVLESASNSTYTFGRNRTFSEYDTKINWHCNVVEVIVKVF